MKELVGEDEHQEVGNKVMTIRQGEKAMEQWRRDNEKRDNLY